MKIPVGDLKEQSLRVQKGENPDYVGFWLRTPAEKPDPPLPAYYFLGFIVNFFLVYGLLGGGYERKNC